MSYYYYYYYYYLLLLLLFNSLCFIVNLVSGCIFPDVLPFKSDLISEHILQKLIKQNVVINFRFADTSAPENYLYRCGKPSDCFIMILQGRVEVEFGKENLTFEGGPFTYFGMNALRGFDFG